MAPEKTKPARDRGEMVAELVLLVPIVVLLVMIGLQAGVQAHTSHVAAVAAAEGAAIAAAADATAADGIDVALETLRDLGAVSASAPRVEVSASEVAIVVEIAVPRLLPIFPRTVVRRAVEPRERILREWER